MWHMPHLAHISAITGSWLPFLGTSEVSEAELASGLTFPLFLIIVLLLTMPPTVKYIIYSTATVSPTCRQLLLCR